MPKQPSAIDLIKICIERAGAIAGGVDIVCLRQASFDIIEDLETALALMENAPCPEKSSTLATSP